MNMPPMLLIEAPDGNCHLDSSLNDPGEKRATLERFTRNMGECAMVSTEFSPALQPRFVAPYKDELIDALDNLLVPRDLRVPFDDFIRGAWTLASHRAQELEQQWVDPESIPARKAIQRMRARNFTKKIRDLHNFSYGLTGNINSGIPNLVWVNMGGDICLPSRESESLGRLVVADSI